MLKHLLSAGVSAALIVPSFAFALELAPLQATSSAPERATTSTSSGRTPSSDPQEANADYLLEIDGIKGESKSSSSPSLKPIEKGSPVRVPGVERDEIGITEEEQEANTDYLLEIDGVKGESTKGRVPGVEPDEIDLKNADDTSKKKGNVEYEWKVEEGESAPPPGVEPDELAVPDDAQPITPDFGILLGGSGGDGDDEEITPMEELILNGLKEEGAPAETLSLNYDKIKTTSTKTVKLFGFIPVDAEVTVEVDAKGEANVHYPWWAFLASGKDSDSLGEQIVTSLSNVLKNKQSQIESLQ